MAFKKYPPTKDRRDIGQVVFLSEKMASARDLSSCCVGIEASLESNSGFEGLIRKIAARDIVSKPKSD